MRGERTVVSRSTRAAVGSSPHARGTQRHRRLLGLWRRFIPACAGNAVWLNAAPTRPTVHPRMRGERRQSVGLRGADGGSSPHARGTPMRSMACAIYQRFIPACAGNAEERQSGRKGGPVHPRMRGERSISSYLTIDKYGSSPHARGTREGSYVAVAEMRFIPACAGNASGQPSAILICPVHPRMRGERRKRSRRRKPDTGSSPHARGTPSPTTAVTCRNRFIPACAGNALTRAAFLTNDTVHPRMRGERVRIAQPAGRATGSSPHARGTRRMLRLFNRGHRFIPACAGNAANAPIV